MTDPQRLGHILMAEGLISEEQLEEALRASRESRAPLLHELVRLKHLEEDVLANFLAHQAGLSTADQVAPPPAARNFMPSDLARRLRAVPLAATRQKVTLAVENPGDVDPAELRQSLRLPPDAAVEMTVATISQMTAALTALYGAAPAPGGAAAPARSGGNGISRPGGDIATVLEGGDVAAAPAGAERESPGEIDPDALMAQMETMAGEEASEGQEEYSVGDANEPPVIKMCTYLIAQALKMRASDIHINPTAKGITVRYRVDGTLQTRPSPPASLKRGIIARFKVMSRMNITERRKPQDGRIKIRVLGRTIDLRVSVIPQMEGENIVMRILDQSSLQLDLRKLGFEEQEMRIYAEAIRSPYGMILHTGPTGSGKTTTLYSAISYIFDPKKSFITLEDPVEYEMPSIVQVQMDHDVGLDFATALRSALRQDPNIMMVGEIRDTETAKNAIQAALTGHLLFSTLHTNDAPSTIGRLIDIGIAPAYVGTALRLIVAQRLMKRACKACKQPYQPTDEEYKRLEVTRDQMEGAAFMKGAGCPECNMTGYSGRIGLYEMLRNTPEIQELIFENADSLAIRKVAESQGMRSLRGLALEKWRTGLTTAEEVQRVTMGGD